MPSHTSISLNSPPMTYGEKVLNNGPAYISISPLTHRKGILAQRLAQRRALVLQVESAGLL
jgi:hypothetical protein